MRNKIIILNLSLLIGLVYSCEEVRESSQESQKVAVKLSDKEIEDVFAQIDSLDNKRSMMRSNYFDYFFNDETKVDTLCELDKIYTNISVVYQQSHLCLTDCNDEKCKGACLEVLGQEFNRIAKFLDDKLYNPKEPVVIQYHRFKMICLEKMNLIVKNNIK